MIRGLCLGHLCPSVIARIQASSGSFLVCWSLGRGGWVGGCNKWIQGWSNGCSIGRRGRRERLLQGNELGSSWLWCGGCRPSCYEWPHRQRWRCLHGACVSGSDLDRHPIFLSLIIHSWTCRFGMFILWFMKQKMTFSDAPLSASKQKIPCQNTERQCTHLAAKLGDHAFMHQIMGKEVDTLFQIENSPCAIHLCNTQIDQIKIPSWLDLQQWSVNPTELCVASERCTRVNQVQRKMWGGKKLNKQTL